MFGKDQVPLRKNRPGVTGILWRTLKKRERLKQVVCLPIDEYYTSQVISLTSAVWILPANLNMTVGLPYL